MNNGTSQNEKNKEFKECVWLTMFMFTDFSMCTTCFVFWSSQISCHQRLCCKLQATQPIRLATRAYRQLRIVNSVYVLTVLLLMKIS